MHGFLNALAMTAFFGLILAAAAPPARAQVCHNDYMTIETFTGAILEIHPAPEPFQTSDIVIEGSKLCARIWLQVMKEDIVQCRVGQKIEVTGLITADADTVWQIAPETSDVARIGTDYTCH